MEYPGKNFFFHGQVCQICTPSENFCLKISCCAFLEGLGVRSELVFGTTVHEKVFASGVAVDVNKKCNLPTFERLPHHILHGIYLWR